MRLKIKNFQSIGKADIDIADFTLFVGPSNSGKTAIVRSLAACIFNTPGSDYVTKGETETAVQFEDGENKILYTKGKTAKYRINDKGYAAIGRGSFDEVEKLGYRDLNFEGSSVRPQFSFQHDPPFLVSPVYSAATISSIFGSLSNSEIVRKAKHLNEKDIKTLTSEVNAESELLEKTNKKLEAFTDYEQAEKLNKQIELSQKQVEFVTEKAAKIDSLQASVTKLAQHIGVIKVLQDATEIIDRIEKNKEAAEAAERVLKAQEVSSSLKRIWKVLEALFTEIGTLFDNILKKKAIIAKHKEYVEVDVELFGDVNNLDSIVGALEQVKTCPLCENQIDGVK